VDLERPEGVLVVGGDEDDRRRMAFTQCGDDLEAIEMRHLNVQQYHVGSVLPDGLDCFLSIGACRHYLGIGLRLKEAYQPLPPDRLVIRDHYPESHRASSS
jgi:hypothetical protein